MESKLFLDGIHKFGATKEEICQNTLGITPEAINQTVILSPGWNPERLFADREVRCSDIKYGKLPKTAVLGRT